jgi:hypothetical protein
MTMSETLTADDVVDVLTIMLLEIYNSLLPDGITAVERIDILANGLMDSSAGVGDGPVSRTLHKVAISLLKSAD